MLTDQVNCQGQPRAATDRYSVKHDDATITSDLGSVMAGSSGG